MEKLSKLAMLDEKTDKKLAEEVKAIIKMADILSDIDTAENETENFMELRCDEVCEEFSRDEMLCNAPCVKEGYVITKGGIV